MLNPFQQDSLAISSLVGGDRMDGRVVGRILRHLFSGNLLGDRAEEPLPLIMPGSAPSFVLESWESAEFRNAVPGFFKHSPGVLRSNLVEAIDYMRRHRGQPWERAREMQNKAFADVKTGVQQSSDTELHPAGRAPHDPALVQQWYDLVQDPEHLTSELAAFPAAWKGAIELQATFGNSDRVQNAYTLAKLDRFLASFGMPAFRQAAIQRIDSLIEPAEILRDALRVRDRGKALEVATAFATRLIDLFGDAGQITTPTLQIVRALEHDIQAEDYDAAMGSVLALLATLRGTRASLTLPSQPATLPRVVGDRPTEESPS
jgi:hypothetical protein